jgi:hypothetical protein
MPRHASQQPYERAHGEALENVLGPPAARANRGGRAMNSLRNSQTAQVRSGQTAGAGVDRNTSIRSIMTLPAYSSAAREDEQILGREGERAGIDSVVEFPETAEEEENRRDGEMEALYQIRQSRRAELADRQERQRLRREARERGDTQALNDLREAARRRAESTAAERAAAAAAAASTTSLSNTLGPDHAHRDRQRRTSAVNYSDVGLARHDGTRIRASSESERPLLDSAASIGGSDRTMGTGRETPWTRSHDRSGSVISMNSQNSDSDSLQQPSYPGGRSRATSNLSVSPSLHPIDTHNSSGSGSSGIVEVDVGSGMVPPPPEYEGLGWENVDMGDAPPYESPVQTRTPTFPSSVQAPISQPTGNATRSSAVMSSEPSSATSPSGAPQLPEITSLSRLESVRIPGGETRSPVSASTPRLPNIEITAGTPVNSAPPTPISGRPQGPH